MLVSSTLFSSLVSFTPCYLLPNINGVVKRGQRKCKLCLGKALLEHYLCPIA